MGGWARVVKNDSDSAAGFIGDMKKVKCDELKASQSFAAEPGGGV